MPLYDYYCESCDITEEVMHSITEDPEIKCKKCGSVMRRLISGGGVIEFWGEGKVHYISESSRGKHIDH